MKNKLIFLVACVFLLLNIKAFTAETKLDPKVAESLVQATDDPLLKADYYSDAWLFDKAIAVLEASGKIDAETMWRLARSHIDKGENLTGDDALILYEKAMDEAQQAVNLDPRNALSQQTLAVACGRVALFKGVFKSIGLVKSVHTAALNAVATGDSVPIALYVLGRTHKKLIEKPGFVRSALGLGWANEDSISYYFDLALEVSGGDMIQCRVEYADYLLENKKDNTVAKKMLEAALSLPLRDEQDEKAKKRAEGMLKEIGK
jgi:tetratricopeptide (TPR) repeat protein